MNDISSTAALAEEKTAYLKELDETVAGGWNNVVQRLQKLSELQLGVAANIHTHRKAAMDWPELREAGLLVTNEDIEADDCVQILAGFRPPKQPGVSLKEPDFASPFDAVRTSFPSNEVSRGYMSSLDRALRLTVDAVAILAKQTGMPSPTFEQMVNMHVELARVNSVASVLHTAASVNLSSGRASDEDVFGVGYKLAGAVNRIIPSRCVPNGGRITLPGAPSIDDIVAANLLDRFVMSQSEVCYEFVTDSTFKAACTNTENHGTIAAGIEPCHEPKSLCFDNRIDDSGRSNTELVIEHAESLGKPMDFAVTIAEFADSGESNEFKYERDLISTLFEVCDSPSLAMRTANLYLANRFPVSEAFREWARERNRQAMEKLPGYLENAPKPQPESVVFQELCKRLGASSTDNSAT